MASGVVSVGRHRYAVGLYWENSPGSGRVAQIAREAANQAGQQAQFYSVRPGNKNGRIPQFGLCAGDTGQLPGMPVLAACLAGQIPGSWAGAFRTNEGIAVIIVRDDLIVPDGDLFFADETEARDRLIQEIGFGGLQATYAPESWSITGADSVPLTLLLNDRKDIKLQPVHMPKQLKLIIGGCVAGFLIIVGAVWFWQERTAQEELARQQQAEALRRMQDAAHGLVPSMIQPTPPPEPKYERVWESAPPAMAVINACYKGMAQVPIAVVGWKLNQFKCTGTSISLGWTHEKGISAPPPNSTVNESANAASETINLPPLAPRGQEALIDPDVTTKRYLLQNWPGNIARLPPDPPPPPPPGYTGPWNPPPAPWVKRSFTLTVSELPAGLPEMVGDLPGTIINSISGSGTAWNVEGVIYENRK